MRIDFGKPDVPPPVGCDLSCMILFLSGGLSRHTTLTTDIKDLETSVEHFLLFRHGKRGFIDVVMTTIMISLAKSIIVHFSLISRVNRKEACPLPIAGWMMTAFKGVLF